MSHTPCTDDETTKAMVGQKIVAITTTTKREEELFQYSAPVIVLESGDRIVVHSDDECNNAGNLNLAPTENELNDYLGKKD